MFEILTIRGEDDGVGSTIYFIKIMNNVFSGLIFIILSRLVADHFSLESLILILKNWENCCRNLTNEFSNFLNKF